MTLTDHQWFPVNTLAPVCRQQSRFQRAEVAASYGEQKASGEALPGKASPRHCSPIRSSSPAPAVITAVLPRHVVGIRWS